MSSAEGKSELERWTRELASSLRLCRGASLEALSCSQLEAAHLVQALATGWTEPPGKTLALSWEFRLDLADRDRALRIEDRRVFSADDPYIELRFSLGDRWMGEVVNTALGTHTFDLQVTSDEIIVKVELVEKGVVVASSTPGSMSVDWRPSLDVTTDTYAYAKVTEADGNVALSAPIWIDVP